ncbi:hypothetical protein ABBQ38_011545 [Trebouxia sp. C0009 RCD-2024]
MTAAELVRVRKVVQCVCLSFRELGVNDLTWDLISKAADGSVVVRCCLRLMHMRVAIVGCIKLQTFVKSATRLGRSLHDLVILSLAGFPKSGCLLLRDYWDQISLETISSDLPIEGQQLVQSFLQKKGYIRASSLADSCFSDSRELLLAFGWLLVHDNVLEHVLKQKVHLVDITSLLPPYPEDLLQSREAAEAAKQGCLFAHTYVQDTQQACANKEGWAQVQFLSDHALVQYSKVCAKIRSLQSLNQSRHRLCQQMTQIPQGMQAALGPTRKQRRLTLYEAALLNNPERMERHQRSLEAAAGLMSECTEAMHHARIFFGWLAGLHNKWQQAGYLAQAEVPVVPQHHQQPGATLQQLRATANSLQPKLQAAIQQATCTGVTCFAASNALPEPAVMPILTHLQRHVKCTQAAPHNGSLQSRHDLPVDIQQDVEAVKQARMLRKLPWAGMQLNATYLQLHQLQEGLIVEGNQLPALDEIARLKSLVLCAAKALAKTRAQNRQALQQAVMLVNTWSSDSITVRM